MKVTGIIVEYNPLHNGHLYHLQQTKQVTNCDYVVAVMSGNFVQRGEPAIVNKWARAEAALNAGVDLVIELPVIYSISSAENFAYGAISILNKLNIIDSICFGSESGDIEPLFKIAQILAEEPKEYKNLLKKFLKQGLPYPKAREFTLNNYFKDTNNLLQTSNNILGVEYLKALIKLNSNIKPYTIKRIKNNYNDINITSNIASATSIRHNFDNYDLIKTTMPEFSFEIIQREKQLGKGPVNLNNLADLIFYKIRSLTANELSKIHDISEGLENKIKYAAEESSTIEELLNLALSKRYTKTRLQRILLYILLDITKEVYLQTIKEINYIRILAANSKGRKLLKYVKDKELVDIPIIINPSKYDKELLSLDIKATDIYVLGYNNPKYKIAVQDLKNKPILL
ncbi:nucleotidyltransferase [Caloramator sp. Dgby_cultured_2]|uniref:nucleotidyltransferase n=1 Tax=Caloramator sp. Dgby_cultured_2 TaxID=3029174 RepID=UPI00237E0AD1|nr:nucleotidyltransferase [Caloramator sp. Dgby_cultured_2]WDU84063.1 nucleotidyltransferase [Caloramator sp. Dgby_cultured_2]